MFNSVNNPFGNQRIESALSTGQEKRQHQQEKQEEEKKYLENDDKDQVQIGELPPLTEDEVLSMTYNYISRLKSEHENEPKVIEKLDKFLKKFDAMKFMKQHPGMTSADFHMIMFNETASLVM